MRYAEFRSRWFLFAIAVPVAMASVGCVAPGPHFDSAKTAMPLAIDAPRELSKEVLPPYRIEPPDIIMVDAINVVPKSPYHLKTLDKVTLQVDNALPDAPIRGIYPIEPGGFVQLGLPYGTVKIAGLTIDQAREAIEKHLLDNLKNPKATLSLTEMGGKQQIAGEHLVGPDGTVTLGSYGSVDVLGMTVSEAKGAIEQHLSQHLEEPEVSVEVFAYNSKVFYVIIQGLGTGVGDHVGRFPVMGNETVLDAISGVAGLAPNSSTRVWVARPCSGGRHQILPVDWQGITECGDARSNYQVRPGDRVFVAQDSLIAMHFGLNKFFAPMERVMGFSLMGAGTVTRFSGHVLRGGGNSQAVF